MRTWSTKLLVQPHLRFPATQIERPGISFLLTLAHLAPFPLRPAAKSLPREAFPTHTTRSSFPVTHDHYFSDTFLYVPTPRMELFITRQGPCLHWYLGQCLAQDRDSVNMS